MRFVIRRANNEVTLLDVGSKKKIRSREKLRLYSTPAPEVTCQM